MNDLFNLELPMAYASEPKAKKVRVKPSEATNSQQQVRLCVHLPSVERIVACGDRDAEERSDLMAIAQEAQAYAKLALVVYDADRLCSWLSPTQRSALMAYIRALNLLAFEAHLRSTLRLPTTPAPLPIRRLCGYLRLFRQDLPKFSQRLRLDLYGTEGRAPPKAPLGDFGPSLTTTLEVTKELCAPFG